MTKYKFLAIISFFSAIAGCSKNQLNSATTITENKKNDERSLHEQKLAEPCKQQEAFGLAPSTQPISKFMELSNSFEKMSFPDINGKYFFSGELYSKTTFTYGRFTARMQPASFRGTVSAFFLYNGKTAEEYDIEILGGNKLIVPVVHPCRLYKEIPLVPEIFSDFHEYTLEWKPKHLAWLIDNKKIFEVDLDGYSSEKNIILSANVVKSWDGKIDFEKWVPHKVSYDYIRYYPYIEESNEFSEQPSWEDEFNDILENNWVVSKSTAGGVDTFSLYNQDNVRQTTDQDGQLDIWLTTIKARND